VNNLAFARFKSTSSALEKRSRLALSSAPDADEISGMGYAADCLLVSFSFARVVLL